MQRHTVYITWSHEVFLSAAPTGTTAAFALQACLNPHRSLKHVLTGLAVAFKRDRLCVSCRWSVSFVQQPCCIS